MKNRHRSKWSSVLSFAFPELTTSTTAALSQRHSTLEPDQCLPHIAKLQTIGNSSFGAIVQLEVLPSHCHWNQWGPQNTPHPQDPNASDTRGVRCGVILDIKDTPFHPSMKQLHHCRSERTAHPSLIQWSLLRKAPSSSSSLRTKVRPGRTTIAACWRWPSRHSRSCLLHAFLCSRLLLGLVSDVAFAAAI